MGSFAPNAGSRLRLAIGATAGYVHLVLFWIGLGAIGGLLCTVGDHLHVAFGVLAYPRPFLFDQAWWVPLLFGLSAVFLVRATLQWFRDTQHRSSHVIGDGIAFFLAYAITSPFHQHPNLLLGSLTALWALRLTLDRAPLNVWAHGLLVALGGCLFEASWSAAGFFHYLHPDVIGIPRWLGGIYLHASPCVLSIAQFYKRWDAQQA